MNTKFQEIIEIPAMVVPAMSTEEINHTLLEASVEYIKHNLSLETLILIATKIQYFMGMRGNGTEIANALSKITELATKNTYRKNADIFIDSILSQTANIDSKKISAQSFQ